MKHDNFYHLGYSDYCLHCYTHISADMSIRFCVGFGVQHKTPEEGQRTYWPKHCKCNNKDEDNGLNILNDKEKIRYLFLFLGFLFLPNPSTTGRI